MSMQKGIEFRRKLLLMAALGFSCAAAVAEGAESSPEGLEFFEKKIRPVLVERCYKCHGAESAKLKGGLHLDTREGLLKGGDTRAAIVPGDPDKSLFIEAIRYENPDLQMPPKGKLASAQINDLISWVKQGAPWPAEIAGRKVAGVKEAFDLQKRRGEHWCWKPIRAEAPPPVRNTEWATSPIDHFILARLEAHGLTPAPPADKRSLIRRASYDITGLPPAPEDVEAFCRDDSPDAFAQVVDRLLSSPRFGERWARHWLDLMRYAETLGHEGDYPIPNAWRYRDYLIRAFNTDLPYDQFVSEQVAGDLLPHPRLNPAEGFNESLIGPVFYWLTQQTHSPVDVRQHQAELIDNQIDVLTKTFQAVTVSCARCHDHKFDAISTQDFYAFYGILSSSRYAQRTIDGRDRIAAQADRLVKIKTKIREERARDWARQAVSLGRYLLAAREVVRRQPKILGPSLSAAAAKFKVDPSRLEKWVNAVEDKKVAEPTHPLFAWATLAGVDRADPTFTNDWKTVAERARASDSKPLPPARECIVLGDFETGRPEGWQFEGNAFLAQPTRAGDFVVGDTSKPLSDLLPAGWAHSGTVSPRLEGVLRSPTFAFQKRYLHLWVAGRGSRINIVVDNFVVIQDPIYGTLRRQIDFDDPRWVTVDLEMWKGHRGYLEFCDQATPEPTGPRGSPTGYIAVQRALLSDLATPPVIDAAASVVSLLQESRVDSAPSLASAYELAAAQAVASWGSDEIGDSPRGRAQLAWLRWLVQRGLLEGECAPGSGGNSPLAALLQEFREIDSAIPPATTVPAMADGTGWDEHVFIRGVHKNPGPIAPRRFLEALAGSNQPPISAGSGRLELARHLVDPANPLTARVMVNRVWQHLFGQGIVPTVDNFGVMGQLPTHPELLDWLADHYQKEGGWSTKKLIRLMMTSRAYQMSSKAADAAAEEKDSNNDWLHRMRVRRLEGEAIRDTVLSVSGRLNVKMFGPPVPIHLTPFLDGRGRPASSGPLDGDGRRSGYVEVRRNFLSAMMLAFDTPIPASTVGRRSISNVPAQALILMNDPFIAGQARIWATRMLHEGAASAEARITRMYLSAFSRPPTETELGAALHFLTEQGAAYDLKDEATVREELVWADLGHVLFNVKEFVFMN